MYGLGDNFYQRAVLKHAGECDLETPYPEIYADLPINCIKPRTVLRTQLKNINQSSGFKPGRFSTRRRIGYDGRGTILESMIRLSGIRAVDLDMSGPSFGGGKKPVIIVRPCVVREEWRADARNPMPEYIAQACDALKDEFRIVSIADLEDGKEWVTGELPFAHETYHNGELSIVDLMRLMESASGVIGGVGWVTPMSMAYKTPHLCIFGGWGQANGPQRIFDPRVDTSHIIQALPDNYCMCDNKFHDCDKTITNIEGYIDDFRKLARETISLAA